MSTGEFADHFSAVASGYAAYRPRYPDALSSALAQLSPTHDAAWDCACGSGQASVALAAHFRQVYATDASARQVAQAVAHPAVSYHVAPSEASGLASASVSLVTVAQALHWFDVEAFHTEARRVLVPGGVIAEWCYTHVEVPAAPNVARVVNDMDARLKSWWPPQRALVDAAYSTIPFPFERVSAGDFAMVAHWTAGQLEGYVATWSAVTRFRAANDIDPMREFASALAAAWGSVEPLRVCWPLVLRVGRAP